MGFAAAASAQVRGAQVGCVNAMMRYVYDTADAPRTIDVGRTGPTTDLETGGASEGEEEAAAPQPLGTAAQAHEDPIDAFLRQQPDNAAATQAPALSAPPALRLPPHGIW